MTARRYRVPMTADRITIADRRVSLRLATSLN
jgi:hypothetical protein